jgi:hypothetical protein
VIFASAPTARFKSPSIAVSLATSANRLAALCIWVPMSCICIDDFPVRLANMVWMRGGFPAGHQNPPQVGVIDSSGSKPGRPRIRVPLA